jgi:4-amino-4-deoxy-L-arabinose transferase-like glycosyltransferase
MPQAAVRRWSPRSLAIIIAAWTVLQLGGIFSPGLLDDVDSIYIQIAREMLQRHDFVTPTIDGIRFFDKPPLMYWMASASMSVFGIHDWAARLPLAVAVLALLLSTYVLGNRFFASISPTHAPDRGGFYSALALATAVGPYLYTRFFIPDILIALWMTLGVHLFLTALERVEARTITEPGAPPMARLWPWVGLRAQHEPRSYKSPQKSPLLPCLAFAAIMALNVLTKGLIGAVFPIGFVLLYLALTSRLHLLPRFHLLSAAAVFLLIAAPWHIFIALRNPAIPLPAGLGLPAQGGWAWFYLYNEHIARFLSKRIPHDYGQTPVWLFWLYTGIWTMPWTTFLPAAIAAEIRDLRGRLSSEAIREAALAPLLWAAVVIGFFTLSARQEYYALPAIPALTLMAGGLLARADSRSALYSSPLKPHPQRLFLAAQSIQNTASRSALRWSAFFLTPVATLLALICGYFALFAPHPAAGSSLSTLLATNPDLYNLSLGHLFDLTGPAMGLFRRPLAAVTIGMITLGPASLFLRTRHRTYAANLTLAAGITITLLAAHEGLIRFNPILGSKDLATAINATLQPDDLVLIDCELTCGSSLIFYTNHPVHVVNGRFNGLWYGSFWPDAPALFEDDASLRKLWAGSQRVFLLTYHTAERRQDLSPVAPTKIFALSGGKSILTNR